MKKFLALACVLVFAFCLAGCSVDADRSWDEGSMGNAIPYPENGDVEIAYEDDEAMDASVSKFTSEDFTAYIDQCRQSGYTIDEESTNTDFSAYNSDGYRLDLIYYESNEQMSISLDAPLQFTEITWPQSEIAQLIPAPKSSKGVIEWQADYGFVIYVGDTTHDDFNAYADQCMNSGFSVDYDRGDDYFRGTNADGYKVSLSYEGNNTMFVRMDAPDGSTASASSDSQSDASSSSTTGDSSEVSPDFKEAMDSYEAFFDEYIAFMQKYKDSGNPASMAADYASYMQKYSDTMSKLSAIDTSQLSTADALYYSEVNSRIASKLASIQ